MYKCVNIIIVAEKMVNTLITTLNKHSPCTRVQPLENNGGHVDIEINVRRGDQKNRLGYMLLCMDSVVIHIFIYILLYQKS